MNILPKKSWHVRTKKNIERVRRDEAEAAAKEKELQKRAKIAELEASLDVLRGRNDHQQQAGGEEDSTEVDEHRQHTNGTVDLVNPSGTSGAGHLNLFREVELHEGKLHGANNEAEKDKKREAEEWEKKVGILQYLGQNSNQDPESNQQRFYQKVDKTVEPTGELSVKQQKQKEALDPMMSFPKYAKSKIDSCKKRIAEEEARKFEFGASTSSSMNSKKTSGGGSSSSKSRKWTRRSASSSTSSSSDSDDEYHRDQKRSRKRRKVSKQKSHVKRRRTPSSESDPESEEERRRRKSANLDLLRKQRLEREEKERKRTQDLLSNLGQSTTNDDSNQEKQESERNRRYNSQYNPHLAKH